ncbi:hypothetical protein HK405_014686, partial [Cladochytrium tenue]
PLLTLPDGSTPLCERIYVCAESRPMPPPATAAQPSPHPTARFHLSPRELRALADTRTVVAVPGRGLRLPLPAVTPQAVSTAVSTADPHSSTWLPLGSAAQDVLAALGAPARVFAKDDDKMRIHRAAAAAAPAVDWRPSCVPDAVWNYFHLGLDVVMDGERHVAVKFVLHANTPGHYDFNRHV